MHPIVPLMMFMSVLFPSRAWTPITQPVNVEVRSTSDVTLLLSDFSGKTVEAPGGPGSTDVVAGATADIHKLFIGQFSQPGTYLLWAVPKGKTIADFEGTPLVVELRRNVGPDAAGGPAVVHLEPLVYAAIDTDQGPMSMAFFYDVAPNTVDNFLKLTNDSFYDGLTFHRVVPGFIVQGGDPRGDGTGGPGYSINAEFSDRQHVPGTVSMARETDPAELDGGAPRPEYANSAGSQFFIAINYDKTKALDHHYTAFGTIVRGMDTVNKIAGVPLGGTIPNAPKAPPVIKSIKIKPVTPHDDPYAEMLHLPSTPEPSTEPAPQSPTTQPTTTPDMPMLP